ncbi:flavodoxin [Salibacterium salarium]|uniref:Flavodoxin n=1 Tax=Salibacterium salarium TaxID=284579 RepID=A0A3R9P880_9BACI|nr:flavodoxin [Salibacterium salarium]RSL32457.1 flavodoxin [Salibacterium salarium]
MVEVLLAFVSMSGNTEEIADLIEDQFDDTSVTVTRKDIDMDGLEAESLEDYDGILIGTYTWGDGDLPFELEDFHDDLDDVDLTGKDAAVFGSCDSSYAEYGKAIDIMSEKLKAQGAAIVLDNLKIELDPQDEDVTRCETFAQDFIKKIQTKAAYS